jgi:hypothetical protein
VNEERGCERECHKQLSKLVAYRVPWRVSWPSRWSVARCRGRSYGGRAWPSPRSPDRLSSLLCTCLMRSSPKLPFTHTRTYLHIRCRGRADRWS